MCTAKASRPEMREDRDILILDLGNSENLFDEEMLTRVNELLDEVEQYPTPRALVTVGSGRHWCNGTNLRWLLETPEEQVQAFTAEIMQLYARFLALPVISVAALQGHAFANGVILALSHDFRVMRSGKIYVCLPNANVGYFLTRGEAAVLQAKLPPSTALEMIITGRRYQAPAAAAAGLIDNICFDEAILESAEVLAQPSQPKHQQVIGYGKRLLYQQAIETLRGPHSTTYVPQGMDWGSDAGAVAL
ncbi:enoyl-CoA hydratase/isomerase family protein [Parafrankia sp. FMc2]|uniref:enoyl-CoA hydratase/isomerase family protein n=1 Tax=Parafrankia sp. FMc2 TaxID=3233196 RepID=UPI0034D45A36